MNLADRVFRFARFVDFDVGIYYFFLRVRRGDDGFDLAPASFRPDEVDSNVVPEAVRLILRLRSGQEPNPTGYCRASRVGQLVLAATAIVWMVMSTWSETFRR
jgi:hypothetical protein